jgi:hypothetical protein
VLQLEPERFPLPDLAVGQETQIEGSEDGPIGGRFADTRGGADLLAGDDDFLPWANRRGALKPSLGWLGGWGAGALGYQPYDLPHVVRDALAGRLRHHLAEDRVSQGVVSDCRHHPALSVQLPLSLMKKS